jgi:glycerol-3-phosphate O-acyltransferase
MLTKENHTDIAKIIQEAREENYTNGYINFSKHIDRLCEYFKQDNSNFNEEEFRAIFL